MNRIDQILELVLAERREVEATTRELFDGGISLQLDQLIAVEDLLRDYKRDAPRVNT